VTTAAIAAIDDFRDSVIAGLSAPRKATPARFFYDERGSQLFEAITRQPEYYPTRVETGLLRDRASEIARLTRRCRSVVEFGSGSSAKTPLLLAAVRPEAYVPIDISADFLDASAGALADAHPDLDVIPVAGDFTTPLMLPDVPQPPLGFFPGSTLGNFTPGAAIDLLRAFRETLGDESVLAIGLDLKKNRRLLEAAYDDAEGVTAAFNLNLLHRINCELNGDIPVDAFEHRADWHDGYGRIEMHLVATRDIGFTVAGRQFAMIEGETIHTENSYKYTIEEARLMARASGWEPMAHWTDDERLFSFHVWRAAEAVIAP
jgi:L-histidine Nalpha-methyltransferase